SKSRLELHRACTICGYFSGIPGRCLRQPRHEGQGGRTGAAVSPPVSFMFLVGKSSASVTVCAYCVTLTLMVVQRPSIVLCWSSPSCSVSLCCPGGSCISISDLPSPKCTHGEAFWMTVPAGRQSVSTPT